MVNCAGECADMHFYTQIIGYAWLLYWFPKILVEYAVFAVFVVRSSNNREIINKRCCDIMAKLWATASTIDRVFALIYDALTIDISVSCFDILSNICRALAYGSLARRFVVLCKIDNHSIYNGIATENTVTHYMLTIHAAHHINMKIPSRIDACHLVECVSCRSHYKCLLERVPCTKLTRCTKPNQIKPHWSKRTMGHRGIITRALARTLTLTSAIQTNRLMNSSTNICSIYFWISLNNAVACGLQSLLNGKAIKLFTYLWIDIMCLPYSQYIRNPCRYVCCAMRYHKHCNYSA